MTTFSGWKTIAPGSNTVPSPQDARVSRSIAPVPWERATAAQINTPQLVYYGGRGGAHPHHRRVAAQPGVVAVAPPGGHGRGRVLVGAAGSDARLLLLLGSDPADHRAARTGAGDRAGRHRSL